MTIGPVDPSLAAPLESTRNDESTAEAAKQFEQLLMQQLWQAMRSTVGDGAFGGQGAGASTYMHFLDEAVATALSEGGGVGLAAQLQQSLGPAQRASLGAEEGPTRLSPLELGPRTGQRVSGATGRLQGAATELLTSTSAARFSRAGRLTAQELASDFQTNVGDDSVAVFNVRDAAGFSGEYKCNLFAFELARRAGFQVPVVGRRRGWGYPNPDAVTADAADGRVRRDWGRVVTGESATELDRGAQSGARAFMLSGSGSDGHAGHMAVVERVHEVSYDEDGEVRQIVFDGWEARATGARHLERRTWNRLGSRGGHDARAGLDRIEIIELLAPRGGRPETPLTSRVGRSHHDAFSSSRSSAERPMPRMEEME